LGGVGAAGGAEDEGMGREGWKERSQQVVHVWCGIVDTVARALCGEGGGDPHTQPGCVPTLLAAEMAMFLGVAARVGVARPSVPVCELLAGALQSAGGCTSVVRVRCCLAAMPSLVLRHRTCQTLLGGMPSSVLRHRTCQTLLGGNAQLSNTTSHVSDAAWWQCPTQY
jgi:hypothetical protein